MRIVNPSILLVCTVGLLGCDSASPTVDVSTDSALDVGQQDGTVVDSRIDSGAADSSNDNGASADASGTDAMFTHDGSAVDGAVRDSAREVATGDGGFNCDAQDARGEGSCRELLGYRFDGTTCAAVVGCNCAGSECALFVDQGSCFSANRDCLSTCPSQSISGQGLCDNVLGYRWNGLACESVSGCSCSGRECGSIYPSSTACEADHQQCGTRDCRRDGCTTGTCQICFNRYTCVPDDAAC